VSQCEVVVAHPGRSEALDRLPLPYSTALRLHDAGVPDEMIAERIGIEPAAMPVFLRLAWAKLAAVGYDG
jgi:hypothetical protein